jgi:hypothetical protein
MNKKEFLNKIIGTPWVDRAYGFDGCDCFGLVYLYLSEVEGKISKLTNCYLDGTDFQLAFNAQLNTGEWARLDGPSDGAIVFMMYAGDVALHCGIMLDKVNCLHAFGSNGKGQTVIWKMPQVKKHLSRFYKLGEAPRVEFFKWVG